MEQHLHIPEPRLAAILVGNLSDLLLQPHDQHTSMRWQSITHNNLHRHVFTIRCPDQAFYLDAIKGYLTRRKIQPLEQQAVVFRLDYDADGRPLNIMPPDEESPGHHMFIAVHISATTSPEAQPLAHDLDAVLRAVDDSVRDFPAMHERLGDIAHLLDKTSPEGAELLRWMIDDRYICFGLMPENKPADHHSEHGLTSGNLGVFRNRRVLQRLAHGLLDDIDTLKPAKRSGIEWLHLPACQQYLYRAGPVELVRICWKGTDGLKSAFLLGHFSRSARYANASQVPLLRDRWQKMLQQPLLAESAFYRREIRTLFDRMPKSLLMAVPPNRWLAPLKIFADQTGQVQTHSVLFSPQPELMQMVVASLPADRFGPNVVNIIEQHFAELGLRVCGHESFGVGSHRIVMLACTGPAPGSAQVASAVQQSVIFWKDRAKTHVLRNASQLNVPDALARLSQLPPVYQNIFPPEQFVDDIRALDWVASKKRVRVHVRLVSTGLDIQIFSPQALPLGSIVSIVQSFGLTAMREAVVEFGENATPLYLSSLSCRSPGQPSRDAVARLTVALDQVFNDEAISGDINALLLTAGLDIQQIAVLTALRDHVVQLLPDAAPLMMTHMLNRHPKTAAKLYRMFEARHRPTMPGSYMAQSRLEFDKEMEQVTSLTDDRWFRAMAELVEAGLRSNAFNRESGEPLAIKIDPARVSYMPKPVPYREIFVRGVHVEGVHLRAGPLARGGLRYSDRLADFRTEVLELMATQTVKNGQIVPTGAKGGFVLRNCDNPDEAFVQAQYRHFVKGLLALTDNRVAGDIVAHPNIRIASSDANDSYLVVAADKGTARYSDLANNEAQAADFWLGDAFASGGRYGFDHKQLGITARGAWVCATQHLAELDIDAWHDAVRVVGIGDMSGDVFGNGMLLNPNMHLLAAFNHRHIFLDPQPVASAAFAERQRLFNERLGWDAYDAACISKGGGVFNRSAKSIALSEHVQPALGISEAALSGEALIRAILCAPVDLLYNGGIGTYVRANHEGNTEVSDPANNAVRISADQVRAKVICEGGNLGMTQASRLEYAAAGGRINTDAIDNSAGVDMSDHEVNLKILFSPSGADLPIPSRNRVMRGLATAVTGQCLDNNLMQSRALSLAVLEAMSYPPRIHRLRDVLLAEGRISPQTDDGIEDEKTLGLRPQLAVLLGHEKNRLHDNLGACCFSLQSCFGDSMLNDYFPATIQRRYAKAITTHPLAEDIMHTMAANHVVNHIGLGSVHHLEALLNLSSGEIVLGLLAAEYLLDIDTLRHDIWAQIEDVQQAYRLQRDVQEMLMRFAEDLLRQCSIGNMDQAWLTRQRSALRRYRKSLYATETLQNRLDTLPDLAQSAAALHLSASRQMSLARCLKAGSVSLKLLPFQRMETALRTPAWSKASAYELRRDWLHRLSKLRSMAIAQLLDSKQRSLKKAGLDLWQEHPNWPELYAMLEWGSADNMSHMDLLLLLSRCESLLTDCAAKG